jgi:hypothetical protein
MASKKTVTVSDIDDTRLTPHIGSRFEDRQELLKQDERVAKIRKSFKDKKESLKPDMNQLDELKGLLLFSSESRDKFKIDSPEDLNHAQDCLNELQAYRDRATLIQLGAKRKLHELSMHRELMYDSMLLISDEFLKLAEGLRTRHAIMMLGSTFRTYSEEWNLIEETADLVLKNCKACYEIVAKQSDVARTMWFVRNLKGDLSKATGLLG